MLGLFSLQATAVHRCGPTIKMILKLDDAALVQKGECNMCTDSNKNVYCALCTYQSHKYDISEIVNDDFCLVHNCLAVDKSKLCKL